MGHLAQGNPCYTSCLPKGTPASPNSTSACCIFIWRRPGARTSPRFPLKLMQPTVFAKEPTHKLIEQAIMFPYIVLFRKEVYYILCIILLKNEFMRRLFSKAVSALFPDPRPPCSSLSKLTLSSNGYPVNPRTIGHRIRKKGMSRNSYQKDLVQILGLDPVNLIF